MQESSCERIITCTFFLTAAQNVHVTAEPAIVASSCGRSEHCSAADIGTPRSFCLRFPGPLRSYTLWVLSPSEVARPVDDWEAGNCSCKSSKFVEQQKVILSGGNHHILVATIRLSLSDSGAPTRSRGFHSGLLLGNYSLHRV